MNGQETKNFTRVVESLRQPYVLPSAGNAPSRNIPRLRLAAVDNWRDVDPSGLLPVKAKRCINTKFGYQLRQYWFPATDLTVHRSASLERDGEVTEIESVVHRSLVKCRADVVTWRDRGTSTAFVADEEVPHHPCLGADGMEDILFAFNRSEQSLRSRRSVSLAQFVPDDIEEARICALVSLPFPFPIGPRRMGSSWIREVNGRASMRYEISSEVHVGETRALLIRKHGTICMKGDSTKALDTVTISREGVTVYAYDRSVVLEDRVLDLYEFGHGIAPLKIMAVEKLVKSVPSHVAPDPDREAVLGRSFQVNEQQVHERLSEPNVV